MRIWTRASGIESERASTAPSEASPQDSVAPAAGSRPWYADVWIQMLRKKPLGTLGGAIVLVMLAAAVCADWITPYGFSQTSLRERFIAMNPAHWLGTDQLGRDLLTRLVYGARISLYVGFGAVALGSVLATAIIHEEKPWLELFQEVVVYGVAKRLQFTPRADYRLIVSEMTVGR